MIPLRRAMYYSVSSLVAVEGTVVAYSLAQVVAESAVVSDSAVVAYYDPMAPVESSAPSRSLLVYAVRWSIPCSVPPQVISTRSLGKV